MNVGKWEFPENLLYDAHYQWIKCNGSKVLFGLTSYGLDITGDVIYLALPATGAMVNCGSSCGSLEAGKWVGRVYSPVTGKVTRVNESVVAQPGLISQNPYDCWFAEVELSRPEELADLMITATLEAWLAEDMKANG